MIADARGKGISVDPHNNDRSPILSIGDRVGSTVPVVSKRSLEGGESYTGLPGRSPSPHNVHQMGHRFTRDHPPQKVDSGGEVDSVDHNDPLPGVQFPLHPNPR